MAIIRIKRTTGFGTPTGLTFGELAFVQGDGSEGRTANRLYIADNRGVCVWIGAEILNSPTYWSGATAETTVPTVGAVEGRIVAGGGVTFSGPITVNIADGKFFGKYKKNDVIPATGQTVKWVIEDALQESVAPVVTLTSSSTVAYGQTSGTITLVPGYTIKTAGATAVGSTLEFRYAGAASWTTLSTTLKNNNGQDVPYSTTYDHTGWNRASDAGSGGTYGFTALTYRWTVHDTSGVSASIELNGGAGIIPGGGVVVNPSVSFSAGITAASLRTGVFGAPSGTENNTYREKGNTFTTVNFQVSAANTFIPLTNYVLQASERIGNSTSWSAWTNVKSEAISGTSPITRGLTYMPTNSGQSLDAMRFRVRVNDIRLNFQGTTFDSSAPEVFFDYLMFFGGTANTNIDGTVIRGLSSGIVAGSHNTTGGGAGGGFGAIATTISNVMSQANAVAATGPNSNTRFIIATPDNVSISTVIDSITGFDVAGSFNLSSELTTVNDRSGIPKNYNVYIMTNTGYVDPQPHLHTITRSGSVAQP